VDLSSADGDGKRVRWRPVRCLSCSLGGAECQYVSAEFSRSAAYYVLGCLGPAVPTYRLRSVFTQNDVNDTGQCLGLRKILRTGEFLVNFNFYIMTWLVKNKLTLNSTHENMK